MMSVLVNKGRPVLEIEMASTHINRVLAAAAALQMHYIRPGQVQIEFLNPSTSEVTK